MFGDENQNVVTHVKDDLFDEHYALLMESEWDCQPHLARNITLLQFFIQEDNLKNLVRRLEHNFEVMAFMTSLFCYLQRAHYLLESPNKAHDDVTCEDAFEIFDATAKKLFNCPKFSRAFSDLYYEEDELYSIVSYLVMYKNERQPRERMKRLMKDPFIDIFVEETTNLFKARVVLSVLFGCWIDEAISRKLARSVIDDQRFQQMFLNDTDCSDTIEEEDAEDNRSSEGMKESKEIYPPLDILRPTRSECIYNRKYSKVLAEQVNDHEKMKSMIYDIVRSLRHASTDGDELPVKRLFEPIKQLFKCPDFIKACVETCCQEGCYTLIYDIDIYQNEQSTKNRIKLIWEDVFFKKFVLGANENLDITRRALSVFLSYWSDEVLHKHVGRGVLKLKDSRLSSDVSRRDVSRSCEEIKGFKDSTTIEPSMCARDGVLKPHEIRDKTITEYIYNRKYSEILAVEVNKHRHLNSMIDEIMRSLLKGCKGEVAKQDFDLISKQLFNSSEFMEACVETSFQIDSFSLVDDIDAYINKETTENQIKVLLKDVFLKNFLKDFDLENFFYRVTERLAVTRGVLSVLLGYRSDHTLHKNVSKLLRGNKRNPHSLNGQTGRAKIKNFKVSPTIEGLKEAMVLSFPVDEAKLMCEQIERHKFEFKLKLWYYERHWIKGLEIVWFSKEFKIRGVSFAHEHVPYYWE